MKRFVVIALLLSAYWGCVNAQTIDLDAVFTGKYQIDQLKNLSWRPSTQQYSYLQNDTLFCFDGKSGQVKEQTTLSAINDKRDGKRLTRFPYFEWVDKDHIYFPSLNEIISIGSTDVKVKVLPDNWIDADLKHLLFVIKEDNQVYVKSEKNNFQPILLCPDTGTNIVFGSTVHRSEWGIDEGQYISPKGNYIAFYRMDESMVEDYPIIDINEHIATYSTIKYPMAGQTSHQVKVGIFDVNRSVEVNRSIYHYVQTDLEDGEFLTNITFSPDEKSLFIAHVNREQNQMNLIEYDVQTGKKVKILIQEYDERYVEPQTRPLFFNNSSSFIWQSRRDGWNHLYLYNRNGDLISQLTEGKWEVTELYGLDPKERYLFYTSTNPSPIGNYIYSLNLKSKKSTCLTHKDGTHYPLFSDDKSYFIDYFTNLETPRQIELINSYNGKSKLLLNAKNPYSSTHLGRTEILTIQNNEGDSLYCRIIFPPNFNSSKKYPVFLYVYGGPHSQLVTNSFMSGGVFLNYMAQQGYIVFTLDNRGTAKRGAQFEQAIHRKLGVLEMEDQMAGVRYLLSQPYVDAKNISLDGWSYGGFMVLSLISTYPEYFNSATCGGPVVDWSGYEIMYGERYMDTPQENPEGYHSTSILPKVKNINANLLIFHGGKDDVVLWQHSLKLLNQAVEDGILINYFVYPNHEHNVRGLDRVHLWKMIEQHHKTYLKQ